MVMADDLGAREASGHHEHPVAQERQPCRGMNERRVRPHSKEGPDQPREIAHEVKRRSQRGIFDRPAQPALRSVHHVQLEFPRKARVDLHIHDALYAAERRPQRADDKEARHAGTSSSRERAKSPLTLATAASLPSSSTKSRCQISRASISQIPCSRSTRPWR